MMKNILFFFSSTIVGGAETNIVKISRELTKTGYKVFWAVLVNDGPLFEKIDFDLAGKIEVGLFYKKPFSFLKCYKRFVKANNIDIVFNFGLRVELISRLVSKQIGVKKIISNIRSTDDWRKKHHVLLDRFTQRNVDIWVSNSEAGKIAFNKREKIPLEKIHVIYNFFEQSTSLIQRKKEIDSVLKIGVLANITKEKGYFDLIAISSGLNRMNILHKFIYAGKDKTEGNFAEELAKKQLERNFEYLGYVDDKKSFFDIIDIFILPSYLEGMPTVLLEAMTYGKPIITTDVGGIPELIENGKHGFLFNPGDIEGFLKAICKILALKDHNWNEAYRLKLSNFDKKLIMQKWCDLIYNL